MAHRMLAVLAACSLAAVSFAQQLALTARRPADFTRKRWEWFYQQRAYPRKRIPTGARLKALRALDTMIQAERAEQVRASKVYPAAAQPLLNWVPIGPQPTSTDPNLIGGGTPIASGRVTALAVDPTNSGVVYLGGAEGGVWKTADGGTTWTPLTDTQASLAVGSIVLDPSNPSTVYVGTGEENFNGDAYYGAGILKSTDGGSTWTQVAPPFAGPIGSDSYFGGGAYIGALAVDPSNSQVILAADFEAGRSGIYRSGDGGATWSQVLATGIATAALFDPSDGNTAYAAIGGVGIFKSSDSGQTWTPDDGTSPSVLPASNLGRIEVAIDPSNPTTLYAGIENATTGSLLGLFSTTDGGAHWAMMPGVPDYCGPQCFYDSVVRVDPANSQVIFLGGAAGASGSSSLYRSNDGGKTWSDISSGSNGVNLHVDSHALAFSKDGSLLYVGNDGGVWSTSNVAASPVNWTNLNNTLALSQFYPGISIDRSTAGRAFGGTQDDGTQMYSASPDWNQLDPCGDGGWTAIDSSNSNIIYAACTSLDPTFLTKSIAGGAPGTFFAVENGIDTADRVLFIPPMVMDLSNSKTLYFGTFRVYQTIDGANNWTPISNDLTAGPFGAVSTIAVAPSNSNTVYAGTSDGQVQVTTNAGGGESASWTNVTAGLPKRAVTQLAVDPIDPNTAYVTLSGFSGFEDSQGHVFKTSSRGTSWTDISGNLPNIPVNDIVVDPNLAGTIYVATDVGVFSTTNGGMQWSPLGNRLPKVAVLSLKLHAASRTLRAASHGRGAWDLQLPISASVAISPLSLSFPGQTVGTTSAAQTVTLTNNGASAVTISSIASAGDFAETNSCGGSVAGGSSCVVQVTFSPKSAGTRVGTVTFTDSDPSSPQAVPLTGTGQPSSASPVVALSTTSLNFGNQAVGTASGALPVVLINSGGAPLNISNVAASGSFGESDNCGSVVAAQAECVIGVTFAPTSTGTQSGALTITDNATGSPQAVALSGAGIPTPPPFSGRYLFNRTDFPGAADPTCIITADFNGDGIPDLAVCDILSGGRISISFGKPDGTFQSPVYYASGTSPTSLLAADFNGDGKLDLAMTNSALGGIAANNMVMVLLGNGDGTFQAPVGYAVGNEPASVAVGGLQRRRETRLGRSEP